MRIFLLTSSLPSHDHTVGAGYRVLYSLIDALQACGHTVLLQPILQNDDQRPLTKDEQTSLDTLIVKGTVLLPILFRSDYRNAPRKSLRERLERAWGRTWGTRRFLYPACSLRPLIARRADEQNADLFMIFWSPEGIAATEGNRTLPKIAYYGMPDHIAQSALLKDAALFSPDLPRWKRCTEWVKCRRREQMHLAMMRDCDTVFSLSADHAEYYRRHGHPRAFYLQNMWPAPKQNFFTEHSERPENTPLKIVGSLGHVRATGNTYGLYYIGTELLHRLDNALGPAGYQMHIFGSGEPATAVRHVLKHPAVRMRGWVENIDEEIRSSHIFLVTNNAGRYQGSHTRFLHGWSLKSCCIAHANNARANPEMVHEQNVLLGATPDELVAQIIRAGNDANLRKQIGEGGYTTYRKSFTPEAVTATLFAEMERLVSVPE